MSQSSDAPSSPWSQFAVASPVLGFMACVSCGIWIYAVVLLRRQPLIVVGMSVVLGLGAVICGVWALRQIRRRPGLRGKALAILGIVLGALPLSTLF